MAQMINETNMMKDTMFKYEDRLKSPIRRFQDKNFVPVTYYHINGQKTTTDQGYGDVTEIIGKESPVKFEKIEDFPLYGIDQIVLQLNNNDQGLDTEFESDAVIMAGTIKPLQNDYFIIDQLKDPLLFRVTSVEYDAVISSGSYKITYMLEYNDHEMNKQLKDQTVDSFTCILDNIGTSDKCIIQSDVNEKITKIDAMYDELCNTYMAFYYNERYNCFLADFGNGMRLFDPFQLEFIMNHQLFNRRNSLDNIFMCEQFEDPRRKIKYQKTIYRFVEKRDMSKLSQFNYSVFGGTNNQQTAFAKWLDGSILILDIPRVFDPNGNNTYHVLSNEYVDSIRLNGPTDSKSADLIQRYLRSEDLTINDISLDICDEIMNLDDANLEVFFFTPIILYIIKDIVHKTLSVKEE